MNPNYINILEKTNQQLSLWYNPYTILITTLAVLFTVLTIIAAFIIFSQSSEYKKNLNKDREEYKKKLSEFLESQKTILEENQKQIKAAMKSIDDFVEKKEKELKSGSIEQQKEIKKLIDKLEVEKITLRNSLLDNSPFNRGSTCSGYSGFSAYNPLDPNPFLSKNLTYHITNKICRRCSNPYYSDPSDILIVDDGLCINCRNNFDPTRPID